MSDEVNNAGAPATHKRIELVWPGKSDRGRPVQDKSGEWSIGDASEIRRLYSFTNFSYHPEAVDADKLSLVVSGDRLDALATLSSGLVQAVRLAYLDVPRIRVDDKDAAFKGDSVYTYSTWLSVLRTHLRALLPLIRQDGFVVIHTGDLEEPFARLVAEEELGPNNRVATVVWQRSYGPRNMKGMTEFTATHDCLLVYAVNRATLTSVGLRGAPQGFDNPDDDPRGAWKAEHKGAHSHRDNSDFDTFTPPYRWRLTSGELPPGVWRINPLTGVVWGLPTESGVFTFELEVTDAAGVSARKTLVLKCLDSSDVDPEKPSIPWLFSEHHAEGAIRITTETLPAAVVGEEYSAIVLADGGSPFNAPPIRPGSGRYWEFARDTLVEAYQTDSVYLGRDGKSIPHPKQYLSEIGDSVVTNQVTWWPGRDAKGAPVAGYTQDATKHLKRLVKLGLVKKWVSTAKPERLLARLVDIFTDPNDLVLEMFGGSGDMAAVATKRGRRFLLLSGTSDRERELLEGCALPRLRTVVDGKDRDLFSQAANTEGSDAVYLPFEGGGFFASCTVGEWVFERSAAQDFARMNPAHSNGGLAQAVLTSQGFFVRPGQTDTGRNLLGTSEAVILAPNKYLSMTVASELASGTSSTPMRVFYFKASDDFDERPLNQTVLCRRVPSDIRL